MRISIMQPGYIPWLGFFELMYNCEYFVLLDDVQYTKKDWRNRNRIRTKHGWIWLTIPVLTKGSRFQLINEVMINNTLDWKKKHLSSIKINYSKAGYFRDYFPKLEKIYTQEWNYLLDLDIEIIKWLKEMLGIKTPLVKSSDLKVSGRKEEKIIGICKKLSADELYDSKAASTFFDLGKLEREKVNVKFQDYTYPVYKQLYNPFIPYMSTIDLLLNHGPRSLGIIFNKF